VVGLDQADGNADVGRRVRKDRERDIGGDADAPACEPDDRGALVVYWDPDVDAVGTVDQDVAPRQFVDDRRAPARVFVPGGGDLGIGLRVGQQVEQNALQLAAAPALAELAAAWPRPGIAAARGAIPVARLADAVPGIFFDDRRRLYTTEK
jgi:hypothetical protein